MQGKPSCCDGTVKTLDFNVDLDETAVDKAALTVQHMYDRTQPDHIARGEKDSLLWQIETTKVPTAAEATLTPPLTSLSRPLCLLIVWRITTEI
jgi:hypothetical protein